MTSAGKGAADDADPLAELEQVIVTGTRRAERTVAESLAPIDVLGEQDLEASGKQSVRDLLGTLVPSINVSNNGAGASWAVRTLSLRGLGGDQLLVLVNGKRRHNSAILFVNGTVQNGQSPPDLDLIPGNAIQRIEVLRDGASAQYGSDAIAGVVNIILKNDTSHGAALTVGSTADNGGKQGRIQVDKGFELGADGGYIHLSGDGVQQDNTIVDSSPISGTFYPSGDSRNDDPDRYRAKYGQPKVSGGNAAYDVMLPVGDSVELYSFGTFSKRHTAGWLTYRLPTASNSNISIYPEGYMPRIHLRDEDFQVATGLRGEVGDDIHYDLSTSYAQDDVEYSQTTSYNPSLGDASPTNFYLGNLQSDEWVTNLDLGKDFDLGLVEPLSAASGAEYKTNRFQISPGDYESYYGLGSQGVAGFSPEASGTWNRNNWSAYVNLEQKIVEGLEIGLAGRHEDYSDFGSTDTGKVSIRIEPLRAFAFRATASTGFRAPTLQQQHYTSASTISVTIDGVRQLAPVVVLPVDSAAAKELGAQPLKPEKSTNFSAGVVLTPASNFDITIDAYQIKVKDRILLSETLQGDEVVSILRANGYQSAYGALIFSNAADTRTRGLDIVNTYRTELGNMGSANFSLSANFNKTIFTHIDTDSTGGSFIGRSRQGDLSEGTPRNKFIANVLWNRDAFNVNLRATRYGTIVYRTSSEVYYNENYESCTAGSAGCAYGYVDEVLTPKVIFDLEVGYRLGKRAKLSVGANNLLNTYPNKLKPVNRTSGSLYNSYSPYGISGGFYYGRLNVEF